MARQAAADARRRFLVAAPPAQSALAALSRFEHFQERIELAEAEAVALAELEGGIEIAEPPDFELDERNQTIEAELAALRERHKA